LVRYVVPEIPVPPFDILIIALLLFYKTSYHLISFQDNQADARFYPLVLDNLLGLKIVAKCKWSPTFKSMFVESFSTDKELFELMETKFN
jgi:hypothetical protein